MRQQLQNTCYNYLSKKKNTCYKFTASLLIISLDEDFCPFCFGQKRDILEPKRKTEPLKNRKRNPKERWKIVC